MNKWIFSSFVSLLMISCGRRTTTVIIQKKLTVFKTTELIADNISEEISGSDELHLMICLVKDTVPKALFLGEWNDSMVFRKQENNMRKEIAFELNTEGLSMDKTKLIFILMESDDLNSIETRANKVKEVLTKANYQYSDSLNIRIRRSIADDDLQELKIYKLLTLLENKNGEITFSGMNLFDKYYYRLNYKWE